MYMAVLEFRGVGGGEMTGDQRDLIHRVAVVSERIALEAIQAIQVALAHLPEGTDAARCMETTRRRMHDRVERLQELIRTLER